MESSALGEMMSVPRWLVHLLSIVGVLSAVAGIIVREIVAKPYFEILVSTAIAAFWTLFLLYITEAKQRHTIIEGAVRSTFDAPSKSVEQGTLMRVLRSGAFDGCGIDGEFWVHYGRDVLADDSRTDAQKLEEALDAIRTSTVEITGRPEIYSYMHTLLRSVKHRGQTYRAITTPEELTKPEARDFILRLSAMYPRTIQRILVLPDGTGIRSLSRETRAALRELSSVVEMKYLPLSPDNIENFGIYGDVAVGLLDEGDWTNKFIFKSDIVRAKNTYFGNLWVQAIDLANDVLQGDERPEGSRPTDVASRA